ncbi:MAG TPA: hypothetical protein DDW85_01640 [Porphyromonadaceae bacterium]|nr:hypothetical protein [Porphyromonadaceae bacterium]
MKKEFTKTEKMLIALIDENEYKAFVCPEHGIFIQLNSEASGECPYCRKKGEEVQNIRRIKRQFRKELGLS